MSITGRLFRLISVPLLLLALACCEGREATPLLPTGTGGDMAATATPTPMPTATPLPSPQIGSTWLSPVDGMVMVYVPAGPFLMGLEDPEGLSRSHALDLRPPETVELGAFWIDRTEVTNGMYELCVAGGACEPPFVPAFPPDPEYYGNEAYADYPVIGVPWQNAQAYCQWAGRRLPTEAEWEKAARGEDGRLYPWGNEAPNCGLANYAACRRGMLAAGSLPAGASPYGALDLAGSAWEWLADWYEPEAYPTPFPVDGKVVTETLHIVRGGSWLNDELVLQSGVRFAGWSIDEISVGFGFRCARDAAP